MKITQFSAYLSDGIKAILAIGYDILVKDEHTGLEVRVKLVAGKLYYIPKEDSWLNHEHWVQAMHDEHRRKKKTWQECVVVCANTNIR